MKKNPLAMEIKVLVAESVPVYRRGLQACLGAAETIRVVGEVEDGGAIPGCLSAMPADVLLLDSGLPGLEGFEVVKGFKAANPALAVLLMANAAQDVAWLLRGIRAGASGVMSKESPAEEFPVAIRRVHAGHPYIAEPLAEKLVLFCQRNETVPLHERLSPREFEVMQWLARGLKLSEIALKLGLSHQTITTHRRHILEKTGLRTTAEIMRYGILRGFGEPEASAVETGFPPPRKARHQAVM